MQEVIGSLDVDREQLRLVLGAFIVFGRRRVYLKRVDEGRQK